MPSQVCFNATVKQRQISEAATESRDDRGVFETQHTHRHANIVIELIKASYTALLREFLNTDIIGLGSEQEKGKGILFKLRFNFQYQGPWALQRTLLGRSRFLP